MMKYKLTRKKFVYTSLAIIILVIMICQVLFICERNYYSSSYENGNQRTYHPDMLSIDKREEHLLTESMFFERSMLCEAPKLNPYAQELMGEKRTYSRVNCEGEDWIECYAEYCYVKDKAIRNNISCIYKDMYPRKDGLDYGIPVYMNGTQRYRLKKSDFVEVSCTKNNANVNEFNAKWYGYKAGIRRVPMPITPVENYNIMVLMLSSASRGGVMRELPKVYEYLKQDLKAVVFNNFNAVGIQSEDSLFPIISGKTVREIVENLQRLNQSNNLNEQDFIFDVFRKKGYKTAFFEDQYEDTIAQYHPNSCFRNTLDHYSLRSLLVDLSAKKDKWYKGIDTRYCFGSTPTHVWMLNLTLQFFKQEGPKLGVTFISDVIRDDYSRISSIENDLMKFIKQFEGAGHLENTMLIIMGDHGSRENEIRQTEQGRLEERLPFLSIVTPKTLGDKDPGAIQVLMSNKDVLTTPFDIHATLLHLTGFTHALHPYRVPGTQLVRSQSLFRPITKTRTCAEAGIAPHWCACAEWERVTQKDFMYQGIGTALGYFINRFTDKLREICPERHLTAIDWVVRRKQVDEKKTYVHFFKPSTVTPHHSLSYEYYQARITMNPGPVIYEGTVTYYKKEKVFHVMETDITRMSASRQMCY